MIGTLFSLVVALFIVFRPLPVENISNLNMLGIILIIISILFILVQTLITLYAWGPIQKAEQNLTPHIAEIFKSDRNLRYTNLLLFLFLIVTYLIVMDIIFIDTFNKMYLAAGWTILLGLAIDLLNHFLKRVMDYLNPFTIVEFFKQNGETSIREGDDRELCKWIDALSETTIKAIHRNSLSLCDRTINEMQLLCREYLEAKKSISHPEEAAENTVSYTLFFLFQRLELIYDRALQNRLEPICSAIVTTLGKIVVYAAKYDMSMASYPIHYIGKFAKLAQKHKLQEVANRAIITLTEVSKIILDEVDIRYANLKDPFLSMITHMQDIAKETFRHDKTISMQILAQPFHDLKKLFQEEKVASHQDTIVIIQNIDRVIEEFKTLEEVLRTLPPLPKVEEKESEEQ